MPNGSTQKDRSHRAEQTPEVGGRVPTHSTAALRRPLSINEEAS
jgi:hypothetical protein